SPEKNAIKELELGYADFGVASADQVIRALDKGADVVVLAQLFQINPMQWIHRDHIPQITTPAQLKDRTIGVTFGGNDETIMNTLLAQSGLSPRDYILKGVRFDFTPFLKKQVEIWPVYRNSQGVILEDKLAAEGESVRFLNPSDFGVDFVANSIITSGKMIKENPALAQTFITALLKAWEAAMDSANQDLVLAEVKKRDKMARDDIRQKQLEVTRTLIKPNPTTSIGSFNTPAWEQTEAIMLKEGQIKKSVMVADRLLLSYTQY
ncbi:MAG: ABC transporter substrate-binding protein, partial [Desulfobacterales bacterium]|nr:ABC transporter substrate-binding protein [Desulfobacterales bacterium]